MLSALLTPFLLLIFGHGADSIAVSAAVSLREPLREIAAEYEQSTGIHVELNFGASGQLMAQIQQGAPVDLFIAAAEKQLDELVAAKLVEEATRTIIARNRLVLIVPADAKHPPAKFDDLSDARFKRIAVGEPKTVPAGQYAMEVFDALKLSPALKDRLVQGANVRQVLSYVERGEVDAGVVYQTDAAVAGDKVRIVAVAETSWHQPIVYPAAIVSSSTNRARTAAFLDYLASEPSRRIFSRWGFIDATTKPAR